MKYHNSKPEAPKVRIIIKQIRRRQRSKSNIDVRPLDQREGKLNTRIGFKRTLIVPQGFTGEQLKIWDAQLKHLMGAKTIIEPDNDLEPAYIKKYKSEMK